MSKAKFKKQVKQRKWDNYLDPWAATNTNPPQTKVITPRIDVVTLNGSDADYNKYQ